MRDRLANQIDSYRARLFCLDRPEHRAIWEGKPPLRFTEKVAEARAAFAALDAMAGAQQQTTRGITIEKRRAREELIDAALNLGGLVVAWGRDHRSETLATPYDLALYRWRGLRDEALLGTARSLTEAATALATGPDAAEAAQYALTPERIAPLAEAVAAFERLYVAPRTAIAHRRELTERLPAESRAVKALFVALGRLLPPFATTPAGEAFVKAYHASGQIIDRGRGSGRRDDDGADDAPPTTDAGEV